MNNEPQWFHVRVTSDDGEPFRTLKVWAKSDAEAESLAQDYLSDPLTYSVRPASAEEAEQDEIDGEYDTVIGPES